MKFLFICVLVTLTTQEDLLLKVVGLIRHGHRTPIEYFIAQDWSGYSAGELTEKGINQEISLGIKAGSNYKTVPYIKDDIQYRDGYCDINKIQIIFSCRSRTIKSGLAYLIGLCHQNYNEIIPQIIAKYVAPLLLNTEDQQKLLQITNFTNLNVIDGLLDSCKGTSMYFKTYKIDYCPNIWFQLDQAYRSEDYQSKLLELKQQPEYLSLLTKFNITKYDDPDYDLQTMIQLEQYWEFYLSYKFQGIDPHFKINNKELLFLYQVAYLKYYLLESGNQFLVSVQVSNIFNDLSLIATKYTQSRRFLQEEVSVEQEVESEEEEQNEQIESESEKEEEESKTEEELKFESEEEILSESEEEIISESEEEEVKSESEEEIQSESEEELQSESEEETQSESEEELQSESEEEEELQSESEEEIISESEEEIISESEEEIQSESEEEEEIQSESEEELVPIVEDKIKQEAMINAKHYNIIMDGITIYSGHDNNIISLLRAMLTDSELAKLQQGSLPPFGSSIYIEFWKNNDVEIALRYNSRIVRSIEKCPTKSKYTCTLKDFQVILDEYRLEDIWSVCYD